MVSPQEMARDQTPDQSDYAAAKSGGVTEARDVQGVSTFCSAGWRCGLFPAWRKTRLPRSRTAG